MQNVTLRAYMMCHPEDVKKYSDVKKGLVWRNQEQGSTSTTSTGSKHEGEKEAGGGEGGETISMTGYRDSKQWIVEELAAKAVEWGKKQQGDADTGVQQ